jgi:spore maturation protein CgeB
MTKVLLVTPAFHGYGDSIGNALRRRGHDVTVHAYDAHVGAWAKARHKLTVELPEQLFGRLGADRMASAARRATDATLEVHAATRPDVVLVIRGDLFEPRFWDRLDETGKPFVVWLYDEVRRMRYDVTTLARATAVTSYSPLDVQSLREQGIDAHHLPNAFDRDRQVLRPTVRRDEVTFVGARYPDREQTLVGLHEAGVPVRAYGRDWSRHPADRLRTWRWHRPGVPAERDVDRDTAYAVMAGSTATLSMHTDQDGFAMRTFEACGSGAVQLIDRPDLDGLYDDGVELATWETFEELLELCARARTDLTWAQGLRDAGRRRTLAEHTFDHRVQVVEQLWG